MIRVIIDFDEKSGNRMQVNGPFDNKVMFLGILRMAEEIVAKFEPAKTLVTAPVLPINGGK